MSQAARGGGPWSQSTARVVLCTVVVGLVLLTWGWWSSSGTGKVDDQVPGLALGVVALMIVLAAALSWVAAGRRAVRLRRDDLTVAIEVVFPSEDGDEQPVSADRVVLPGSNRYHRHDCLLVRGKDVKSLSGGAGSARGRTACEMCQP